MTAFVPKSMRARLTLALVVLTTVGLLLLGVATTWRPGAGLRAGAAGLVS